jgi:hypothetical protein
MNSSRWYLSRRATKISEEFGCRPDTLRERLVNALGRRYRKQVASAQLITAVYGARSKHAATRDQSLVPLRDGTLTLGSFFELNFLKK